MAVVQIRVVGVLMDQVPMGMGVAVGLTGRIGRRMLVAVVGVMGVRMLVHLDLLAMQVLVPLRQMEVEPHPHQRSRGQ